MTQFVSTETIATASSKDLLDEIAKEKEIKDPGEREATQIIAEAIARGPSAGCCRHNGVPCKEI